MATNYSTKGFFRTTPNALLARYFKAWLALPEAQRAPMMVR